MSTTMVLLLAPLVLAAVLTVTAPRPGHRHRGPRAALSRGDRNGRPRHARPAA
ncbi:hypothetical protein OH807_02835 [Kitasatospora sp. NBC_01560]|uniref:hypothetical protein n=1 Tax=Kitasatospora sp. NBC_01560 TaxID=2975965 RepID=UPI0038655B93